MVFQGYKDQNQMANRILFFTNAELRLLQIHPGKHFFMLLSTSNWSFYNGMTLFFASQNTLR